MEQPAQPQPLQPATTAPATTTTTVISGPTTTSNTTLFDEGFENFFNNESLSDRILNIIETEKVICLYLLKICLLGYRGKTTNFYYFGYFEITVRNVFINCIFY